jgi:hypothetical protein
MASSKTPAAPSVRPDPNRFTFPELALVQAFEAVAPGRGGWRLDVFAGDALTDPPDSIAVFGPRPFQDQPDWIIYPAREGVVLALDGEPPGHPVETLSTMRDALLSLCALSPEQASRMDELTTAAAVLNLTGTGG